MVTCATTNLCMVKKKYYPLTIVPEGTEMIIKKTGKRVKLIDKKFFPLRFLCDDDNGYYTYEVEVIGWPPTK